MLSRIVTVASLVVDVGLIDLNFLDWLPRILKFETTTNLEIQNIFLILSFDNHIEVGPETNIVNCLPPLLCPIARVVDNFPRTSWRGGPPPPGPLFLYSPFHHQDFMSRVESWDLYTGELNNLSVMKSNLVSEVPSYSRFSEKLMQRTPSFTQYKCIFSRIAFFVIFAIHLINKTFHVYHLSAI